MVGYGGSFLKGLAGGLQTGINMGTQLQEMRWQKKQRKQLEETQTRMLEAGNLWNAKIKEISADNIITDEEMAQLSTVFLSGGYEFMEHYGSAMNYITGMKDKEYKQELEWINLYIDGIAGLSPGDIQAAYDFIEPKITSEKGLNMLEAYTNMQKRKQEAMQAQPTAEVFTTLEAARAKYPEAKIEFNAQAGGYVVEAGEVKPPAAPPTELDIMGETQKKLDYAYNTGNANYFNQIAKSLGVDTTFDTYKQKYEAPGKAVSEVGETVTTLKNWEKMFDIKDEEGPKTEEEYNRALELLAQSKDKYKPKFATWKEALIAEAKGIAKELEGITDKKDYNLLLNVYMQKLEEIKAKYPEVNLNQFPEFKEQKNWFDKLKEKVGL